ncbi:MAG: Mur ligase middle domain protein [Candidatus Saccharibacteria bacterium]|nr:Mur ligase middle domain protein [Candidatus Saccharibacteria bacterium]
MVVVLRHQVGHPTSRAEIYFEQEVEMCVIPVSPPIKILHGTCNHKNKEISSFVSTLLLYNTNNMIKLSPKKIGKDFVCSILESQVRRLRKKHNFKLVAVVGSIGKTSTKLAIAHALEPSRRVMYQTGNYNDRVTVPLVMFGRKLPSLFNVPAWVKIFLLNEKTIRLPYFYDVVVVELGTDKPGEIARFAYLEPDITVVTAITPEHMECFKTLDGVAKEELTVCDFSKKILVNADDTPAQYLEGRGVLTYGQNPSNTYKVTNYESQGLQGADVELQLASEPPFQAKAHILGRQGMKILLAAAAVGQLIGLTDDELQRGLQEIRPFAGRMQILTGIKGSTIIDDTYNASPAPVMAALDVLYAADAPQRIAILGNMNELGEYSEEAHVTVGSYCRPDMLDFVVTIGPDAEKYLAPAARAKGCTVHSFSSPYEAGDFIAKQLKEKAIVLAEGSQNLVFAEESLKPLLADKADEHKLVRQSQYWLNIKSKQFTTL